MKVSAKTHDDSVLVKWHLTFPVEAERLSILLFVKAQAME
jgi:hypothetical protein